MSSNPTTAYNQGKSEGNNAASAAEALGIGPSTTIYDDIEYFSGPSSCYVAVQQFINGWAAGLSNAGFNSGVYVNHGPLQPATGDAQYLCNSTGGAWIADPDGNSSTVEVSNLTSNCWGFEQRLKQYEANIWQTNGGYQLNIDVDSAYGPIDR